MDYLDIYRARVLKDGITSQDRVETRLARDFAKLLTRSPNRITVLDGKSRYAAILHSGNSRVGTQTEKKVIQYLLTETKYKLPEGKVFQTISEKDGERDWIILHREIHPYDGYFKYKVLELNHKIKFVNSSGVLREIPAYINGTGEYDIKEYFRYSNSYVLETPNNALNLVVAADKDLIHDLRFIIGKEAWKLVDSDKISVPGVYYTTLVKTTYNNEIDNISEDVANETRVGDGVISANYITVDNTIEIARYVNDLTFYELINGKMYDGKLSYTIEDTSVLNYVDGIFQNYKIGNTAISVTDDNLNTKIFTVKVLPSIPPRADLIGNMKVKTGYSTVFTIYNSYQNVSFDLSDSTYGKIKVIGNKLIFSAADKIGSVDILIKNNNLLVKKITIEITSVAV